MLVKFSVSCPDRRYDTCKIFGIKVIVVFTRLNLTWVAFLARFHGSGLLVQVWRNMWWAGAWAVRGRRRVWLSCFLFPHLAPFFSSFILFIFIFFSHGVYNSFSSLVAWGFRFREIRLGEHLRLSSNRIHIPKRRVSPERGKAREHGRGTA